MRSPSGATGQTVLQHAERVPGAIQNLTKLISIFHFLLIYLTTLCAGREPDTILSRTALPALKSFTSWRPVRRGQAVRTGRTVLYALNSFSWRPVRRDQAVRKGKTVLQALWSFTSWRPVRRGQVGQFYMLFGVSVGDLSGEDRL